MKTLTKFIMALIALATFAACEGDPGPVGPMGPRGPEGPAGPAGEGANWEVIEFDVPADAWNYNQEMGDIEHGYLSTTLDCPEITEKIYKEGLVLAYVMAPSFQAPLPYSRFYYEPVETEDGGTDNILWTCVIDFEFRVGAVDVYLTNSDFFLADEDIADYKFRVVVMW
ncbi:MAG: collagen-like protein [Bacteroidales bacterium]|nr:collagen-like protein [Bacteroidales bacterium]